ncbi:MAG: 50S ribosomal protein L24 [Chloroflexi bacterium]|nr:50S ribosomal protein L24 [Chloroflexota bacterium]
MGIRVKKGDTVEVIAGDDRGKRGEVRQVLPKENRVVVSGVNLVTKHQRPIRAGRGRIQPGRIQFEAPIHISNVMPVCPHCKEATRVGFERQEGGRKVRICKQCGQSF